MRTVLRVFFVAALLGAKSAFAAFTVTATQTELVFRFDSAAVNRALVELAPYEDITNAATKTPIAIDCSH